MRQSIKAAYWQPPKGKAYSVAHDAKNIMAKRLQGKRLNLEPLHGNAITFALRKKAVSIDEFERFVRETKGVLKNVSRAAGDNKGGWVLTDLRYGSAVMSYTPTSLSGDLEKVGTAVLDGFREVEQASSKPSYFSERALAAVRRLSLLGEGEGVEVSAPGRRAVMLTGDAAKNVDVLLRPARRYYGSVVGDLDVLSVHATPSITVYADFGDAVRCFVDPALIEELAKDLLGKRVVVSGEISTNRLGNIISIRGEQLFEAPPRNNRPAIETAGAIPYITGDLTIAAYLSKNRGEAASTN